MNSIFVNKNWDSKRERWLNCLHCITDSMPSSRGNGERTATITGLRSNQQISMLVERLAGEELGQGICGALFAEKSVGAVFGLQLCSGEQVVLKLFHPSQLLTQLAAVHRCLDRLVRSSFPAPPPCSRLFQTEDGIIGAFYTFRDGTVRDAHDPLVRRELAQVLAELTSMKQSGSTTSDVALSPSSKFKRCRSCPHISIGALRTADFMGITSV
ncbi:phosphotransferase [Cyanobacteria bacterium FACHB-DQ100]|nr:phosphotransferase [Cyanobacteria bacterium FACHB-DQ100]